ncbi:type II secretion system F family protein [Sphingomonas sp. SM33]|uniref:Type II secretion system F family protein n=1 Tax=Sphingomonas telluris TaxID=2907998 RepID=A0ABS9VIH0_9SPHN|nr:type II secretion system F family protein [Sphingomonas telluris]MCH8614772.1 type II secretion system F family protein [Sphingomonas telluris]
MQQLVTDYPLLRFGILLALFALVAVCAYFAISAFAARQMSRRRLVDGLDTPGHAMVGASLRSQQAESAWLKLVNGIEKAGLSLVDTRDDSLRKKLVAAGYTAPYAPRLYTLIRLVLIFGLPLSLFGLMWWTGTVPSVFKIYLIVVIAAAAGLYLPAVFIAAKADRRQREIINGFPDALDLMLVCVEAGLGMDAAFARVGMEMTDSHPRLAEQFGAVVLELRAGRSHEDALRRMADRAGAEEIRAFATLLIQSSKLGSSIAQTLRVYAAEMRERRRMRAEEKAHRLPVLLSVPLVGCMLPVMIGVLMLPAVIRVMRNMLPAMSGG